MTNPLGIYIHIPFCERKCGYCDFYSAVPNETAVADYLTALKKEIKRWGGLTNRPIDTIYIGGGTPSVLGEKIAEIVNRVRQSFKVLKGAEITVEANPSSALSPFLKSAKESGVNRLSLGLQSANEDELKLLGRLHSVKDAELCFQNARGLGFKNISLDLMIGLPYSSISSLQKSLDFVTGLNPEHISSYILKLEENTPMHNSGIILPSDDEVSDQYLYMCEYLEKRGYEHYEISNFSKKGFESRHNLRYWEDKEYIGIGPAAHSFFCGERFYYERNLKAFLNSPKTVSDGLGGSEEERIMLALRLKKGVKVNELCGKEKIMESLVKNSLASINNGYLSLTDKGMLVQNSIITELLYEDI